MNRLAFRNKGVLFLTDTHHGRAGPYTSRAFGVPAPWQPAVYAGSAAPLPPQPQSHEGATRFRLPSRASGRRGAACASGPADSARPRAPHPGPEPVSQPRGFPTSVLACGGLAAPRSVRGTGADASRASPPPLEPHDLSLRVVGSEDPAQCSTTASSTEGPQAL